MDARRALTLASMALFLVPVLGRSAPETKTPFPAKVSESKRYLLDLDGKPFFYLGDTAWEVFHRLPREEADHYLKDRAAKKFTVIQAVVLAEFGGLDIPNAYGHMSSSLSESLPRPQPMGHQSSGVA
jgi:hypothetical protein